MIRMSSRYYSIKFNTQFDLNLTDKLIHQTLQSSVFIFKGYFHQWSVKKLQSTYINMIITAI